MTVVAINFIGPHFSIYSLVAVSDCGGFETAAHAESPVRHFNCERLL